MGPAEENEVSSSGLILLDQLSEKGLGVPGLVTVCPSILGPVRATAIFEMPSLSFISFGGTLIYEHCWLLKNKTIHSKHSVFKEYFPFLS